MNLLEGQRGRASTPPEKTGVKPAWRVGQKLQPSSTGPNISKASIHHDPRPRIFSSAGQVAFSVPCDPMKGTIRMRSWALRSDENEVASGRFFCPKCGSTRLNVQKHVVGYIMLYS